MLMFEGSVIVVLIFFVISHLQMLKAPDLCPYRTAYRVVDIEVKFFSVTLILTIHMR